MRYVKKVLSLSLLCAIGAFAQPSRVEVVSATAGNPLRSGAALLRALAGIRSPSATEPALLKIEPGIYDLGTSTLAMRSFVDIEGSGQGVTVITTEANYTIFASSDAELRELTVSNRTTTPQSSNGFDPRWATIQVEPGNAARLTDITVNSEGTAQGVRVLENASAKLHNVDIEIDTTEAGAFAGLYVGGTAEVDGGSVILNQFGFAVDVPGGVASLNGTTIRALEFTSNCVRTFGGTVALQDATVDAGGVASAIVAAFAGGTVNVHHSVLIGRLSEITVANTIVIGASQVIDPGVSTTAECVASYAADFSPVDANCQPIP